MCLSWVGISICDESRMTSLGSDDSDAEGPGEKDETDVDALGPCGSNVF